MSDARQVAPLASIPSSVAVSTHAGQAPPPPEARPRFTSTVQRLGLCGACLLVGSTAFGAPPSAAKPTKQAATRGSASHHPRKIVAPVAPAVESATPPPRVTLSVSVRERAPWAVEVSNDDDRPVRIVADIRLLRFEVRPTVGSTFWCELPASMRSAERLLELEPGSRWVEPFDVRLFCMDRIIPKGSTIVAHLGWPPPKVKPSRQRAVTERPEEPPFIAATAGRGIKEIEAAAAVLPAAVESSVDLPLSDRPRNADGTANTAEAKSAKASATKSADTNPGEAKSADDKRIDPKMREAKSSESSSSGPSPLVLTSGPAASVPHVRAAAASVTLRNEGSEPVDVYARPQLISANVIGPQGRFQCSRHLAPPIPLVDFATRLRPHEVFRGSNLLQHFCPPHTFDRPGLYFLTLSLQAPVIPNRPRSVGGTFTTDSPQLIRIEQGSTPFYTRAPEVSKGR